jgi:hypothetical protein
MRQVRLNAPMRRRCRIALALHLYWVLLPSEARATTGRDVSAHCDAIDYLLKQRHETATWAQLEAALATAFHPLSTIGRPCAGAAASQQTPGNSRAASGSLWGQTSTGKKQMAGKPVCTWPAAACQSRGMRVTCPPSC